MGAFLIRGRLEQVAEVFREALESQDFVVHEDWQRCTSHVLLMTGRSESRTQGRESHVRLTSHGDTTLADASFRCGLVQRIALLVPWVVIITIAVITMLYADAVVVAFRVLWSSVAASAVIVPLKPGSGIPLADVPRSCWILVGAVAALFPLLVALRRTERSASDTLSQIETNFWDRVRKDFGIRLVALGRHRVLSAGYTICPMTVFVVAFGILLYRLHPLVFLCALPFIIFLWLSPLLPDLLEHQPGLGARALAARANASITLLNCLILMLLAFGFGLTVTKPLELRGDLGLGIRPFDEFRRNLMTRAALLDDVHSGDERMRQLRTWAQHYTGKVLEMKPDATEYARFIEGVFIAFIAVPLGIGLWLLMFIGFNHCGKAVLELPEAWQQHVAQSQVDWIRLPSTIESRGLRNILYRSALFLLFVTGAVLNGLALLAAAEVFWIALTDHTLLFPQVQSLASWFYIPFLAAGLLGKPSHLWIWDTLARGTLLILALPPLFIWGRRVLGVFFGLVWQAGLVALGLVHRRAIPDSLRTYVAELCARQGVSTPSLRRIRSKAVRLALLPGLVGRRSFLLVSTGALSKLNETEMQAAIAHEVGHIKQGTARFRWLRIISILGGHPPWFLLLFADLRKVEEDADAFALEAGADPQALASAIVKASGIAETERSRMTKFRSWVEKHLPEKIRGRFVAAFRPMAVIDRFMFSDDLIGYSHPLPRDRIATMLAQPKGRKVDAMTFPCRNCGATLDIPPNAVMVMCKYCKSEHEIGYSDGMVTAELLQGAKAHEDQPRELDRMVTAQSRDSTRAMEIRSRLRDIELANKMSASARTMTEEVEKQATTKQAVEIGVRGYGDAAREDVGWMMQSQAGLAMTNKALAVGCGGLVVVALVFATVMNQVSKSSPGDVIGIAITAGLVIAVAMSVLGLVVKGTNWFLSKRKNEEVRSRLGKIEGDLSRELARLESEPEENGNLQDRGTPDRTEQAVNEREDLAEKIVRSEALANSVTVGHVYAGKVIAVRAFGVFIELDSGVTGLCHVSELDDKYVKDVADVCKVGDVLEVKVVAVVGGRVKFSRRAALRGKRRETK